LPPRCASTSPRPELRATCPPLPSVCLPSLSCARRASTCRALIAWLRLPRCCPRCPCLAWLVALCRCLVRLLGAPAVERPGGPPGAYCQVMVDGATNSRSRTSCPFLARVAGARVAVSRVAGAAYACPGSTCPGSSLLSEGPWLPLVALRGLPPPPCPLVSLSLMPRSISVPAVCLSVPRSGA
jgi:hypothetical protein